MGIKKNREQFIVNEDGEKTAVVVPIDQYKELLEDIHDFVIVAERRNEETITLVELRERLRKDGLL